MRIHGSAGRDGVLCLGGSWSSNEILFTSLALNHLHGGSNMLLHSMLVLLESLSTLSMIPVEFEINTEYSFAC